MSDQKCPNCLKLFEAGDVVEAVIQTKFVPLKSKVTYALERPTDCLEVYHADCNKPKGEHEGD